MSEQKYTLEEARAILDREECEIDGHRLEIVYGHNTFMDDPTKPLGLVCERCGKRWKVTPDE